MDLFQALKYTKNIDITFSVTSHQKRLNQLRTLLASLLSTIPDKTVYRQLNLVIDEMLQNAYEHGNLELSYEDKSKFQQLNTLSGILQKKEEEYGSREILLSLHLSKKEICIKVSNEGPGFNWKALLDRISEEQNLTKEINPSGNGIPLILKIADELDFEENGRVCTFKKHLTK
jgi:two-component system, sensor histidine kinase LadS